MHPLIDQILEASRARGFGPSFRLQDERRDLISSARSLSARGILPVIAEIKPKILRRPLSLDEVSACARAYESYGACAVSVLTEPIHFMGSLENLAAARKACRLPVLRKDFIFDERQLSEARADLVLLIASLGIDLNRFVELARACGMEPLVEVHTEAELDEALKTDAGIIGVNNRNLNTLEVDLGTFERLAPVAKDVGVFLVAESGVHSREDAQRMIEAGADALLVGTALMERPERLKEINRFYKN
jgi:indole-3-glycerol phosphate synthase